MNFSVPTRHHSEVWAMTKAVREAARMAHIALDEVELLRLQVLRLTRELAEADIVIAHEIFDRRDHGFRHVNEWADQALERYDQRQKERDDNSQFGVGA